MDILEHPIEKEEIHTVMEQRYQSNVLIGVSHTHFKDRVKAKAFFLEKIDLHRATCVHPSATKLSFVVTPEWRNEAIMYQDALFSIEIIKDEVIL